MPPPVVLPRERLAALSGIGTAGNCAVVLLRLEMLIIDVAIQMSLCSKTLVTLGTLVWPLMVSLVMARRQSFSREPEPNGLENLLELVNLVENPTTLLAGEGSR